MYVQQGAHLQGLESASCARALNGRLSHETPKTPLTTNLEWSQMLAPSNGPWPGDSNMPSCPSILRSVSFYFQEAKIHVIPDAESLHAYEWALATAAHPWAIHQKQLQARLQTV